MLNSVKRIPFFLVIASGYTGLNAPYSNKKTGTRPVFFLSLTLKH
jgi:hypothetical protein